MPETSPEERIRLFCTALEKLAGKAYVASSPGDAGQYVKSVVGDRPAVSTDSPVLRDCGLDYPAIPPDRAEVGVTSADYALADTGTLVVRSSSEARLVSLLPPVHVAVVAKDRLLGSLDELFTVVPTPADDTSSMVLITGPSRTADIEQILVRGVHGPGELHVVLL
jgi:L-lactate dehydrogenase complex protein LldG